MQKRRGILMAETKDRYKDFIKSKTHIIKNRGIISDMSRSSLYDFQVNLTEWALRLGKAAIFADCGLGKTPMQLFWAAEICRKKDGDLLIITPLAVAEQTKREAKKFGIGCTHTKDGTKGKGITITNYERLGNYKKDDFIGVVCDESSILKNYAGKTRHAITEFMKGIPYRLLCTATPAPNDFMELGTSVDALGIMRQVEMLAMYFTHNSGDTQKWELKGYGEKPFWEFMAMWSRAIRKPSDLGYSDNRFNLPELLMDQITIKSDPLPGRLFVVEAATLNDQRDERRKTMDARCAAVAEVANKTERPFIAWCALNNESAKLTKAIKGAVEIKGSDSLELKEKSMLGFSDGSIRCIVTKPSIAGFGMNWQHCSDISFFPSHSHEQFYQAVRRTWRYGQKRDVMCTIVTSDAESAVMNNMRRKERQSNDMFNGIIKHMREFHVDKINHTYQAKKNTEVPSWLNV